MGKRAISEALEMDPEWLVDHNDEGMPTHPTDTYHVLDSRPLDFRNGVFEFHDAMAAMGEDMYFEPIGAVNDQRLGDIYRFEAKRLQVMGSPSENQENKVATLRAFVEARGLDVQSVSEWYYVYVTQDELDELSEEFPEFRSFAQGTERTTADGEDLKHLRFTENELERVTEVTDQVPNKLDEPMTAQEVREAEQN